MPLHQKTQWGVALHLRHPDTRKLMEACGHKTHRCMSRHLHEPTRLEQPKMHSSHWHKHSEKNISLSNLWSGAREPRGFSPAPWRMAVAHCRGKVGTHTSTYPPLHSPTTPQLPPLPSLLPSQNSRFSQEPSPSLLNQVWCRRDSLGT